MRKSLLMESLHAIHNELHINFKAFDDKSVDAIAYKANFPYDGGLRDITIEDLIGVLKNYDRCAEDVAEFKAEFKTLADFNDAIRKFV